MDTLWANPSLTRRKDRKRKSGGQCQTHQERWKRAKGDDGSDGR